MDASFAEEMMVCYHTTDNALCLFIVQAKKKSLFISALMMPAPLNPDAISVPFFYCIYICIYRVTLLKNVPFLRFLTDEEKEAIINDEKACKVCNTEPYSHLNKKSTRSELRLFWVTVST